MKSKLLGIFLTLLLVCAVFLQASAEEARVYDLASLLDSEEVEALEEMAVLFREATDADIVLVTTDDTHGKNTMDYADDFCALYDFSTDEDYSGVLLLIDMDNRETYLVTSGTMIDQLTDDRISSVLDAQLPALAEGQYFQAFTDGILAILNYVEMGADPQQYRYSPEDYVEPPRLSVSWILISAGVALVVALSVTLTIRALYRRDYKPVAYAFRNEAKLNLEHKSDTLIGTTTTKVRNSTENTGSSSSSSAGRSTTHTTSSGRTHGGGGKKF